jgi:hypothetical protein
MLLLQFACAVSGFPLLEGQRPVAALLISIKRRSALTQRKAGAAAAAHTRRMHLHAV